jgi:hypothetical protein
MLRLELQNAQRSFRVRQLQSEIWRLLPHVTSTVTTVDYELTIDHVGGSSSQETFIDPDEKLAKELSAIRQRWEAMLANQDIVLDEEVQHRLSDNAYFAKFHADFTQQNTAAHNTINDTLRHVINRLVHERNESDGVRDQHQSKINSLQQKTHRLAEKAKEIQENATQQTLEQRNKIQKQATRENRAVRAHIRRLEQGNLRRLVALQQR